MTARHRRLPLLLLLSAAAALVAFTGCAKQSEGQRCDHIANGNSDCNTGLICVPEAELQQRGADRCCPPKDQPIHVASCTRAGSIGGTDGGTDGATDGASETSVDGSAGTGGMGGSGGAGGASGAGGAGAASGAGGATDAAAG